LRTNKDENSASAHGRELHRLQLVIVLTPQQRRARVIQSKQNCMHTSKAGSKRLVRVVALLSSSKLERMRYSPQFGVALISFSYVRASANCEKKSRFQ
jgi:hypothetical protein